MFSNTMIVIYKACDNWCVFSNDTMYFIFHILFFKSQNIQKIEPSKNFSYTSLLKKMWGKSAKIVKSERNMDSSGKGLKEHICVYL